MTLWKIDASALKYILVVYSITNRKMCQMPTVAFSARTLKQLCDTGNQEDCIKYIQQYFYRTHDQGGGVYFL